VRLLHALTRTHASFDDPDLVSHAGLVPVMALPGRAGTAREPGTTPGAAVIHISAARLPSYAGAEQRLCSKAPQAYAQIVILAAQNSANQYKSARTYG
jgi:hypothetical protein